MPADDTLLGQGIVDARNETRSAATRGDVSSYADEHESGQLRIAVPGEQVSLLPLPDSEIPTCDEPQAVDELRERERGLRREFDELRMRAPNPRDFRTWDDFYIAQAAHEAAMAVIELQLEECIRW